VELFADAGFFNQKRRDAAQVAVGKAFVTVLGDDGSHLDWDWGGQHIAGAYLKGLYCLMMEVPEGSWGSFGRTLSALEVPAIAGTDKNAERFKELQENTVKLSWCASRDALPAEWRCCHSASGATSFAEGACRPPQIL
jgi:hypothetical protein